MNGKKNRYIGGCMKKEIEARLLDVDVESFRKKLEDNNAIFVGDWLQMRYCYDFNPPEKNRWIRLRTNGQDATLTIKEKNSDKIDGTSESEVWVSDFEETDRILNKLGYEARSKQENRRIRYILDGVEIDIDMWPMIPSYIEFEATDENAIRRCVKKLGVDFESLVTLDVQSVYKHYGIDVVKIPVLSLEENRKNNDVEMSHK